MPVNLEYLRASNGSGEAVRGTITAARAVAATTLTTDSTTNYPDYFVATTGDYNAETEELDPESLTVFLGHLDGANIVIDSFAPGYTDAGNTVGQVVVIKPATAWADAWVDAMEVSHAADGTLNEDALTQVLGSGETAENLRMKQRSSTVASTATLVMDIDAYNIYSVTEQAEALTIDAPDGTPNPDDIFILKIKDNGTSRAITWDAIFVNVSGLATLTATVANKQHVVGLIYDATAGVWQIVSITTEA